MFSLLEDNFLPQITHLDTKIMVLAGLVTDIYTIGSGSHLGGHLEF